MTRLLLAGLLLATAARASLLEDDLPRKAGRPREVSQAFQTVYGSVQSDGHRLRTILTRPRGDGPFPAVLVAQGIACFSVDNPPFKGSYRTFTDALTEKGFVTLRVEKPGAGDSEGGPCLKNSFAAEVRGFRAAIAALLKLPFVDGKRVAIFGHSLGGTSAPLAAEGLPVARIAVFGTTYGSRLAHELEAGHRQDLLSGKDPAEAARLDHVRERFAGLLYTEGKPLEAIAKEHPALLRELGIPPAGDRYAAGRPGSFVQEIHRAGVVKAWMAFPGRVLAIFGTSDFVASESGSRALVAERKLAGRHAELKIVEGVDHFFNDKPSMKASMADQDGTMSPKPSETLIEFLSER